MKNNSSGFQVEALAKASDILLKMAQGTLEPICFQSHKNKNGSEEFTYAHANGTFVLHKSLEGLYTVGGRTIDEHRRISMAANVALVHLFGMKDKLDALGKSNEFKAADQTMERLQKAFEASMAAVQIIEAHLAKALLGRPPEIPEWDITGQAARAAKSKKIGKARFFHDREAGNEPTVTPRAR